MTRFLWGIDRAIGWAVGVCLGFSAICLLLIMLIGAADVLSTNLMLTPVPAALEGTEVLLAMCIFLSFAYCAKRNEHIRVDILLSRLSPSMQRLGYMTGLIVGFAVFSIIAWRSFDLAISSWEIREQANALWTFPVYPAKFLVSLGAAVTSAEFLRQIVRMALGVSNGKLAPTGSSPTKPL